MPDPNQVRCLLCGSSLPQSALDGETLGPLICDRHRLDEARSHGVIGFPNMPEEGHTPVDEIAGRIVGRRFKEAWQHRNGSVVVMALDDGAVLVFFTLMVQTMYVQYVGRPGITLDEAHLTPLKADDRDAGPALDAIDGRLKMSSFEYGLDRSGMASADIVAVAFEGTVVLQAESVDVDYYGATRARVGFSWRRLSN